MRIVGARTGGSRPLWRGGWALALAGIVALLLAACGGGSGSSSGGGIYGSGASSTATTAPTATSGSAASGGAAVKTASVSVKGSSKTVLTDAKGMTLYYFTKDTANHSTCTDGCAGTWPPLLASGSGTPTSAATLPGTLSAFDGANGRQVAYNGHPLYTYAGDTAAGQANGEGVGGVWFVATPDLAGSGGYGY
ncbi:MAG: COG4315 family predicted lipoprotein [Ktedonobacterales bacterium]